MTISDIRTELTNRKSRSAWDRGVTAYALDLLDTLPENIEYGSFASFKADALNGADDWNHYSWGGCALIYNEDIAERLCTPSEFKRTRCGERRPNAREEWLDTQARALSQAANRIWNLMRS